MDVTASNPVIEVSDRVSEKAEFGTSAARDGHAKVANPVWRKALSPTEVTT